MKAKRRKIFQPGLIYVFSYKKYKHECKRLKLNMYCREKLLNGRMVTPNANPDRAGTILGTGYSINIKWCKCIGREVKK